MTIPIPADRHVIVVGLGFGDEGKGATVDHLCATRQVSTVVRFNGGGQAAHNVIAQDRHHCFRQFGSGTLSDTPTFLSRYVLVNPLLLAQEATDLAAIGVDEPLSLLTVDRDALVTTPIHVAANRTREDERGSSRHGSTGLGVRETTWYDLAVSRQVRAGEMVENLRAPSSVTPGTSALWVKDCLDSQVLRRRLEDLAAFYAPLLAGSRHQHPGITQMGVMLEAFVQAVRVAEPGHLARMAGMGTLVFEGAQGALLDEWRGFHPHTTWSTTTALNAQTLLAEAGLAPGYVLGATRGFTTRHGAGPFPTEDTSMDKALPEAHNGIGEYQGCWRVGHLDLVALRYGLDVVGHVDGIALSHLDVVEASGAVQAATAYLVDGREVRRLPLGGWQDLEHQQRLTATMSIARPAWTSMPDAATCVALVESLGVPVQVEATGPAREDRKTR